MKYAFYVRVSTKLQQDYKRQIEDLFSITDKSDIDREDVIIFKEKESGYKNDRIELEKLVDNINKNPSYFSCVYVTEISRIGRSPRKIREFLNLLEDKKVNLFIQKGHIWLFDEDGNYNVLGKLVLDIMINLADEETRTLKQRSKSGILSSMKAGRANGGNNPPYGFKKDEYKMLVIDEEEAEAVQLIFKLYKSGKGTKVIAGMLDSAGIKTRSHKTYGENPVNKNTDTTGSEVPWRDKTVNDILLNPIYIGKRRYWGGKENRKNKKAPTLLDFNLNHTIIDVALWENCMEIRKSKSHRNYLTEYTYLLKDKIVCGLCGRNYFAKYKPTPNGDKVYICSSRLKKQGNCGNVGINISFLESAIFNEIVASDSVIKHLNTIDDVTLRLEEEVSDLTERILNKENEIHELNSNIDGAISLQIVAEGKGQADRVKILEEKLIAFSVQLQNATKNLSKAKSKLVLTKEALFNRSSLESVSKTLQSYREDRVQLRMVYLQIIDKVIVNVIDDNIVMANIFISLDGIVLPHSLKLFLDISGIRKKPKRYKYLTLVDWNLMLHYDEKGQLLTSTEIIRQELAVVEENAGMIEAEYISIPSSNVLTIPIIK